MFTVLGETKARSPELHVGLSFGCQGPIYEAIMAASQVAYYQQAAIGSKTRIPDQALQKGRQASQVLCQTPAEFTF